MSADAESKQKRVIFISKTTHIPMQSDTTDKDGTNNQPRIFTLFPIMEETPQIY